MSVSLPLLTVSILDAQRIELINQYPCQFSFLLASTLYMQIE
jgi:hypothetical protein